MLIRCPECQFERDIDTGKIPASAAVATCPKCANRFRFRDAETGRSVLEYPGDTAAPDMPSSSMPAEGMHASARSRAEEPAPRLPTEQDGDDPLPPGAIIPSLKDDPQAQDKMAQEKRGDRNPDDSRPKPVKSPVPPASPNDGAKPSWLERLKGLRPDSSRNHDQRDPTSEPDSDKDLSNNQASYQDAVPYEEIGPPWENPEVYGFFGSLYHTILRALFRSPEFFSSLRSNAGLTRPAIFYILLNFFNTLVSNLWMMSPLQTMSDTAASPETQAMAQNMMQAMSMPLMFLLVPFVSLFQLFIQAAFYHLMIRLVQPDRADYNTIVRVIAYSSAPYVLCIVPFVGTWVATLWFVTLTFIGCKYALSLSWSRTALALVPLFLLELALMLQLSTMITSILRASPVLTSML